MIDLPALANRCCRALVRHHVHHIAGGALLGAGALPLAGHSWHRDQQPPGVVACGPAVGGYAGAGYGGAGEGGYGAGGFGGGGFGQTYGSAPAGGYSELSDVSYGAINQRFATAPDLNRAGEVGSPVLFGEGVAFRPDATSVSAFAPTLPDSTPVPEPPTWLLLGGMLVMLAVIKRTRR